MGIGTGWTSVFYAKRGYEVVGQDIAEDAIYYAKLNMERYQTKNLSFVTCDFESMRFDNEFDCAVFYDSLHHAVDEEAAVRMVYKALKPGGVLVTLEPGTGHAEAETLKLVMEQFGVTERDMPPALIMRAGQKAGFSEFGLYLYPGAVRGIATPSRIVSRRRVVAEFFHTFVADYIRRGAWNRAAREMQRQFDTALQQRNLVFMRK